jgi:D-beta-D-heptose 7-phosphate kinase/D-beta-D-heptose 1-phosphate adenosyltransferase
MIVSSNSLGEVRAEAGNDTLALRLGCYDILHEGHYEGLEFAKDQCDILIVGLMPDLLVARRKGPDRPIRFESKRLESIDAMDQVDYSFVLPNSVVGIGKAIRQLKPDIYVEHSEHRFDGIRARSLFRLIGAKCVTDRGPKLNSTTDIIRAMSLAELQAGG